MAESTKPQLVPIPDIHPAFYDHYLPTAFDESLTLVQKYNRMLKWLFDIQDLLKQIVDYINTGVTPPIDPDPEPENPYNPILLTQVENYSIGASGDFKTLTEALQYASTRVNAWNGKINLNLQSGFVLREQVFLENRDYSFVTINRADDEHKIDVDYLTKTYTITQSPNFNVRPAFAGFSTRMPKMNVQWRMNRKDVLPEDICGIYLNNANLDMLPNSGVLDSNYIGIAAVSGSVVNAPYANFSNSGNREKLNVGNYEALKWGDNYRIWNSTLTAPYSKGDNSGDISYSINMASTANVNYSTADNCTHHAFMASTGSSMSARNITATNTLDDAVVAYAGSNIDLRNSVLMNTGTGSGLVATRSSHINFENGRASNCYNGGIYVNRGSSVDAEGATVTDCTLDNITCANGSMLNFNNGTSTGSKQDNLHCNHGFNVTAFQAVLSNAGQRGILAYGAGTVSAENATINNARMRNIEATSGAIVNARGTKATGSQGGYDLSVYYGSVINAYNSNGTRNRTANTLDPNGIIYQVASPT